MFTLVVALEFAAEGSFGIWFRKLIFLKCIVSEFGDPTMVFGLVLSNGVGSMLRNFLFASAVLAVPASFSLFADDDTPKAAKAAQSDQATQRDQSNKNAQSTKGDQANNNNQSAQNAQGGSGHGAHASNWKNPDHCFATCVALGNQEEVALGQIGTKKASNEQVKQFAAMLVTDHHKYLTKLQKFAPEATQPSYLDSKGSQEARSSGRSDIQQAGAKVETGSDSKIQTTSGTREEGTNNREHADGKQGEGKHMNVAQIERELSLQCLAAAKEKLDEKSGAEFDKCFMGQQIALHMGMRNKLIVFQRHASGELAEVLAAGQKKTEEHLAKAEEIMKSLEHGSASTAK